MISAQCDELRQVAQVYRNLGKYATEKMLLDASDTILELRDDLQRANAENDKLRDGANAMRQLYEDELKHALAENAKLRELAKKLIILAFARCADCDLFDVSCALVPTQKCLLWNECESIARELKVEVDDG